MAVSAPPAARATSELANFHKLRPCQCRYTPPHDANDHRHRDPKEAANFERIAGELQSVIARVESTAAQLDGHWQGAAAKAAQAAITRFHEAANAQLRQLNDISTNIHAAGAHYSATDDDHARASAMGLSINAPAGSNGQGGAIGQQGAQVHPQMASVVANGQHAAVRLVDNIKQDGGPQPSPSPQPGFIGQYEQQLTSPAQQAPPPPVLMPSSGSPPPTAPQAPGPMPKYTPPPPFGQCVEGHVKDNVGKDMVKDGFKSAIEKAGIGAAFGAGLTPEAGGAGALPGAVLGFVGGFAQGLIEAPIEAAAKGAWECVDGPPIPGVTKP